MLAIKSVIQVAMKELKTHPTTVAREDADELPKTNTYQASDGSKYM